MASKVRTVIIILTVSAIFDVVAVIAQRSGSTHPPLLITVLTAIAVVIAAGGALGLNRRDGWAWPTALIGALLNALLAVGAIINAPVGAKIGAGVILVLSLIAVAVLIPLRQASSPARN